MNTTYEKTCIYCGNTFITVDKRKITCGRVCAGKYNGMSKVRNADIKSRCKNCGKEITVKYYDRKKSHGYCSTSCAYLESHKEHMHNSFFRFWLRKCQRNKRNIVCTLTLTDLACQWDRQKGICPYTGVELVAKRQGAKTGPTTPYQPSIDRIDSSKGYVPGNIEFVSLIYNFAKNSWGNDVVLDFAKKVVSSARR